MGIAVFQSAQTKQGNHLRCFSLSCPLGFLVQRKADVLGGGYMGEQGIILKQHADFSILDFQVDFLFRVE